MSQQIQKPTFGASPVQSSDGNQQQERREEVGAIWARTSKSSNSEFFSIKMTFTKEMLKRLSESQDNEVSLNLVAFPNRFKDEAANRPAYRIYEEKKR